MPMNPRLLRPLARRQAPGAAFPTSDLLAFWKLADLTDSSGNGNTLTNTNSVTFGAGKIGNAATINNNYLGRSWVQDFSEDFAISLWFKSSHDGFLPTIIDFAGVAGLPVLDVRDGNRVNFNDAAAELANAPLTLGEWTHIVASSLSGEVKLYAQGNLADTVFWTTGGTSSNVRIGTNIAGGTRYLNGEVDAVGVWDRALTAAEVADLYNNGNGLEP